MKKYISLWQCFLKNSVIREMEFSTNFLLQLVGHLLWFVFTLLFFNIIYLHIKSINGWTIHQTHFLIATNQIVIYLYQAFFGRNLSRFPRLIRSGDLDHFLIKPIDIQFISSVRYVNIRPILLLPAPIFLLFYSLIQMNLHPSLSQIIVYILFLFGGITIRYLLGFSIMMLSFIFVEISALYSIQNDFLNYASYPVSIFKAFPRFFFSFLVPVILIANLPASIILQTIKNYQLLALYMIFYILIIFFISRKLFYFCLKHYSSASS